MCYIVDGTVVGVPTSNTMTLEFVNPLNPINPTTYTYVWQGKLCQARHAESDHIPIHISMSTNLVYNPWLKTIAQAKEIQAVGVLSVDAGILGRRWPHQIKKNTNGSCLKCGKVQKFIAKVLDECATEPWGLVKVNYRQCLWACRTCATQTRKNWLWWTRKKG